MAANRHTYIHTTSANAVMLVTRCLHKSALWHCPVLPGNACHIDLRLKKLISALMYKPFLRAKTRYI